MAHRVNVGSADRKFAVMTDFYKDALDVPRIQSIKDLTKK